MKNFKKILALLLSLVMVIGLVAACTQPENPNNPDNPDNPDNPQNPQYTTKYTYRTYATALGDNWNPHSWETNADDAILAYVSMPFCTMQVLDSENGIYQWIYEMATSITDVTKDHKSDLVKYGIVADEAAAADIEDGYVFEIKLNPNAKWENGQAITADDYIYSMKQLLNPEMRNYRANLYYAGESAVAGGNKYYNSGAPIYTCMVPAYGDDEDPDYSYDVDAGIELGHVYMSVTDSTYTLYSESIESLNNDYGVGLTDAIKKVKADQNAYGFVKLTAENKDEYLGVIYSLLERLFGVADAELQKEIAKEALFIFDGETFGEVYDYDSTVGCYKVDDYTIRYVNAAHIDYNYFLTSCTSTWLVYKDYYEANKDTSGSLVTTKYCSSMATTMSYGPYKIASLEDGKQIVFVQNENWYGYEKKEDGSLYSETPYLVDGKKVQRYQTEKIVIDVMNDDAAKLAFLKGDLDDWTPSAEDVTNYTTSSQLYKVDETYMESFFMNTNLDALKEMDKSKGNKNSVVLSNINFRKAFSFAIDRDEWVTATQGYKPGYYLLNYLYFYDVYNNPQSMYRTTDQAMKAIVNVYGVEYGEGKTYTTLEDAYNSINGYNLTLAQQLMKTACDELVADGLYTAGEDIVIKIAYKKGALDSSEQKQIELMNKYINAAVEGSGFGKITLEGVDNIPDRYSDVPNGEYAIGYGAWGGAAFYPFRNFQVYCDPDQYDINEAACWDPTTETLTITIDGEEITRTWQIWSQCLVGNGEFATKDFDFKLEVLSQMEEAYLQKYYRIPLATSTSCSMLSYKLNYYTEEYNIMYGFGGLELMTYNYTDAEWADYLANNTLTY